MSKSTKVEVNRRNARRSTGPKSAAGKLVVGCNATKHGLLSGKAVLPHVESVTEWERHLQRTLADLNPAGYLETLLAERVALSLWRLQRVARYEREAAAVQQERAESAVAQARELRHFGFESPAHESEHPGDVADDLREARALHELLQRFADLPNEASLAADDAIAILDELAEAAGVDLHEDGFPGPPGFPDDVYWEDYDGWTVGMVRAVLPDIAQREECKVGDLLAQALRGLAGKLAVADVKAQQTRAELARYRRTHLLPDGNTLDRINRYETSLERSLYRTLHELQRMQAARQGQVVPAPVAVDVDLSGQD